MFYDIMINKDIVALAYFAIVVLWRQGLFNNSITRIMIYKGMFYKSKYSILAKK